MRRLDGGPDCALSAISLTGSRRIRSSLQTWVGFVGCLKKPDPTVRTAMNCAPLTKSWDCARIELFGLVGGGPGLQECVR
jgi:hypothetical protein